MESAKSKSRSSSHDGSSAEKNSFPVVGIGASAGGLEAFRQFLAHLPQDLGMAFVLVQHLAPKHESALSELLGRSVKMPVTEVKDGVVVGPDHVYVIPPNTNMAIIEGRLHLVPRPETIGMHTPIDFFFRSLAAERGSKAIGVILSGTGSDGTLGLKAIKAEGGITFAQNEGSAKYPGMPQAAVSAGYVDVVLPPEKIAQELQRIVRHPYLSPTKAPEMVKSAAEETDEFRKILAFLRNFSGVNFELYKQTTIRRRVERRMALQKIDRPRDYVKLISDNPKELDALFQDILIHVTGFFRDPATFDALKIKVFPNILAGRSPASAAIRIWVPGCSTGEEVYSLLICLLEFLGDKALQIPLQVFGTDISEAAIAKARMGLYPENIAADVSLARLQRYFVKREHGYQISKTIRDVCAFAKHDLTRDPPFSKMDLISCRNLLIYLGPVLQKKVLSFFEYALKPGGALLLGTSESLNASEDHFSLADKKHHIYTRKSTVSHAPLSFALGGATTGKSSKASFERAGSFDLVKETDRVLLSRYTPAGVVVNDDMQILQFRGRTGPFLEPLPGQAVLSLTKMAREGMLIDLRAAIQNAKRSGKPARREGVEIIADGKARTINIEAVPISGASTMDRYFLILFEEQPAPVPVPKIGDRKAVSLPWRKGSAAKENARLKDDLARAKATLQSVIEEQEATNEELRSANEETLSSNEELQSTNEELETAKEELQSTNEELTTLNEELQNRNLQLSVANSDLSNLLASVNIPIVMVGSDLRIRRVTPIAERMFNIIPTDVGRPIGNIRPNLRVSDLEDMIRESIESLNTREREVQDQQGRWYSLRVRPYRNSDNKIEGAVLALLDIDALKSEVTELRLHAESIVQTVQTPLIVLDSDLRVRMANLAFYSAFQVNREDTENQLIYSLGNHQWDIPELRHLLEHILPQKTFIKDFEVTHDFPKIGRRTMLLSALAIREKDARDSLILCSMLDMTERKQAESQVRDLLESAPEAVVVVNSIGTIVLVNEQVEKVFGYRREELERHQADMLLPERFRTVNRERWKAYFEEPGRPMMTVELLGLRRDGTEFPAEISLSPVRSANGVHVIITARNITERKRMDQALHVIAEVMTLASEDSDIPTMTAQCINAICTIQGWQIGQAWFLDQEKNVLRCDPDAFFSQADVSAFRNASLELKLGLSEGLPGRVWATNSPMWIPKMDQETSLDEVHDFPRRQPAVDCGFKSAFAFPISTSSRLHAVWEFFSTEARDPDFRLLEGTAKLGIHLATVYERRQAEQSLRELSSRLIRVQDEERNRIARELHDSTAQTLAAISMNLSLVRRDAALASPMTSKILEETMELVHQSSEEVRNVSHLLHPPLLDRMGLGSTLRWYAEDFTRRTGIEVDVEIPDKIGRLPADLETTLYRIVQEGTTNIHKHSGSKTANVKLTFDNGSAVLEVIDSGQGFNVSTPRSDGSSGGLGIKGMQQRVRLLGGKLEIQSDGGGTKLKAILPLPQA